MRECEIRRQTLIKKTVVPTYGDGAFIYFYVILICTIQENSLVRMGGMQEWKVKLKRFSEKSQINTDLELFPTQKRILNLKLYKGNIGEEISTDENGWISRYWLW